MLIPKKWFEKINFIISNSRIVWYYKRIESPLPKVLCANFLIKVTECFYKNSKSPHCNFLPLKKELSFILRDLKSLYQEKLCTKYGRNKPCNSGKDDVSIFSLFCYQHPLEIGVALHLDKLKKNSSPKLSLCQVSEGPDCFEDVQILNVANDPSFQENGFLYTQGLYVSNLVEISLVVLVKKMNI